MYTSVMISVTDWQPRNPLPVRGFTMVEAVVTIAISVGVLLSAIGAFTLTLHSALANTARVQAAFLEEEGLEAVRILRDNSWSANIAPQSTASPFYLAYNGSTWVATSTNTYIDATFERKVQFASVSRDANQDIVSSGGSVDPTIRKVTVTVSWKQGAATSSHSLSTYLTNIFSN